MRGAFIIVEGPDGAGKSTVARLVHAALAAAGHRVELHSEPTSGEIGQLIRRVLRGEREIGPMALRCLFAADRYEHCDQVEALLAAGTTVVCDRYAISNIVYALAESCTQAYADWAAELSRYCIIADLTLVLRAPVDVCITRMRERGGAPERFEQRDLQERIHAAYAQARRFQHVGRVEYVDATGEPAEVAARAMAIVKAAIAGRA